AGTARMRPKRKAVIARGLPKKERDRNLTASIPEYCLVVLCSSRSPTSPPLSLLRQLGHLHDIGSGRDIRGDNVEQYAGGRVIAHVNDLHRGHQLIDPDQSIGGATRPAAHLEDIARRNTVLPTLVDEH